MKTLNMFVRAECANCRDGRCLLTKNRICSVFGNEACKVPSRWWPGCQARNPDQSYFEASVLPLAEKLPEYADAANAYRDIIGLRVKAVRNCSCGSPLPKRGRMCLACTRKTRAKEAKEKRRLKRTKLTAFSSLEGVAV
jgi:hypothetical protein